MKKNCGRVYYFGGVNPTYDAAVVTENMELILFQATIGAKHKDVKEICTTRPHILHAAKLENMKSRFVFLVPQRQYFRLTKEQMNKVEPAIIEVVEMMP